MTISIRTELSHNYSFDSSIDCIFQLTLVAESRAEAKGFHHIIVIDTSTSMAGQNSKHANAGAEEQWERNTPGHPDTTVAFSNPGDTLPRTDLSNACATVQAPGRQD